MIRVIIFLNIHVMHVTKITCFFLHQTRHADYYHVIGIITIRTGMLGNMFKIEFVMIKKNFSFHSKDQG